MEISKEMFNHYAEQAWADELHRRNWICSLNLNRPAVNVDYTRPTPEDDDRRQQEQERE